MRLDRVVELFVYALTNYAALIVVTHILVGALFIWAIEGWTPVSSVYFCILTLTTVGYGDLVPKSHLGRVFTSLHTLLGCTIAATCLGTLVGRMSASIRPRKHVVGGRSSSGSNRETHELMGAQLLAAGVLSIGMLYGTMVENWPLLDAFYWAVISCTSVGFGDLVPSEASRVLAGTYLLVAVGGFASAAAQVTRIAAAMERQRQAEAFAARGVTAEVIEKMDLSGDGRVDRAEFMRFMLVANGLVEVTEIDKLDALFDSLDVDGSGSLDTADLLHGERSVITSSGCRSIAGGSGGGGGHSSESGDEMSTFAMPGCTSSEGSETADEAAPLNQAARMMQPVARTRGARNV